MLVANHQQQCHTFLESCKYFNKKDSLETTLLHNSSVIYWSRTELNKKREASTVLSHVSWGFNHSGKNINAQG